MLPTGPLVMLNQFTITRGGILCSLWDLPLYEDFGILWRHLSRFGELQKKIRLMFPYLERRCQTKYNCQPHEKRRERNKKRRKKHNRDKNTWKTTLVAGDGDEGGSRYLCRGMKEVGGRTMDEGLTQSFGILR